MRRLPDLPPAPCLPQAAPADAAPPRRFKARSHSVCPGEWSRLKALGQQAGVTSTTVLVAAFAEVLRAWSTNERFTINFPIFDRHPLHPQVNQVLGDFTNTLLVAVEKTDGTFAERARAIQRQLWEDFEHRHFSGVRVLRELAREYGGVIGAAMPIVVTSLLGYPTRRLTTAVGREVHAISQTPQVLLDFQIREVEGELQFNWDALDAMFPPGVLDDMFGAYCGLLHRLAADVGSWGQERFPMVPDAQMARHAEMNATHAPVTDGLLHELFAERSREQPDALAVVTSRRRLTYAEVYGRASRIGRRLRERGALPNTLVAVVMEKGWEQVVATFAILQSGAAYLPLSPELPKERLWHLLQLGEVRHVLTQSWVDAELEWPEGVECLCVDTDDPAAADERPLASAQSPSDLAYVIFTSGSSGTPKGVMIEHRSVVNRMTDVVERFRVTRHDKALALTALHHDLSVFDIFGMLAVAGGALVIPDAKSLLDPYHWLELIGREQVTTWNSVPAFMQMLVESLEAGGAAAGSAASLRLAILSGDWIPVGLPGRLRRFNGSVQVIGSGGPTETTVWDICYPIAEVDPSWESIPYGRPMANARYYIFKEAMEPCPTWVPGELYIGGAGLSRGYWRDAAKTASSFIPHPETGERLYRSGDLGRYLPDGNIEILGRSDFQIKIKGQRIELGEIESMLGKHPDVQSAVAVVSGTRGDKHRVDAFAVLQPGSDAALAPADLRRFLGDRLPIQMVPVSITVLDRLPLTPNGKVDRLALTRLAEQSESGQADDLTAPRTPLEQTVASLASVVLGVERVGVYANFFSLGGDSISATRLLGRLQELFEIELPLRTLFLRPTVSEICEALTDDAARRERVLATASILTEMSVEEAERVLSEVRDGKQT